MECNRQHTGLQGRSTRSALVEQIDAGLLDFGATEVELGSTGLYPSVVFDLIRRNGDPAPAVRRTDGIRR